MRREEPVGGVACGMHDDSGRNATAQAFRHGPLRTRALSTVSSAAVSMMTNGLVTGIAALSCVVSVRSPRHAVITRLQRRVGDHQGPTVHRGLSRWGCPAGLSR
jgi:hypothetical protein